MTLPTPTLVTAPLLFLVLHALTMLVYLFLPFALEPMMGQLFVSDRIAVVSFFCLEESGCSNKFFTPSTIFYTLILTQAILTPTNAVDLNVVKSAGVTTNVILWESAFFVCYSVISV